MSSISNHNVTKPILISIRKSYRNELSSGSIPPIGNTPPTINERKEFITRFLSSKLIIIDKVLQ